MECTSPTASTPVRGREQSALPVARCSTPASPRSRPRKRSRQTAPRISPSGAKPSAKPATEPSSPASGTSMPSPYPAPSPTWSTVAPGFLNSTAGHVPSPRARQPPGVQPTDRTLKGHWLDEKVWQDQAARPDQAIPPRSTPTPPSSFLDKQKGAPQQPFFMYVGFNAPHDPAPGPRGVPGPLPDRQDSAAAKLPATAPLRSGRLPHPRRRTRPIPTHGGR